MGKRKYKIMIAVLAGLAAVALYGMRVSQVNTQMGDSSVEYYGKNTSVAFEDDVLMDYPMKGYTISVQQADILTYEEFNEKYDNKDKMSDPPEKVYDVEVVIKNVDAGSDTGIELSAFSIEGTGVYASVLSLLYETANPELEGVTGIALTPGKEMTFHLPFALFSYSFRESIWNDLEEFPMYLVATLYPTKKMICLLD